MEFESFLGKIVKIETRTALGKGFGLPLNPKSIKIRKLIEHPDSFEILNPMFLRPGGGDAAFTLLYERFVRSLYQDEYVVSKLMDQKNLNAFWMYLKKNLKP